MALANNHKMALLIMLRELMQKTDEEHTLNAADLIRILGQYGYNADRRTIYSNVEILSDFGNQAYELYQKGESFPPVLEALLKELTEVDEKLIAIRMEHHSNETNANTEGDASDAALGVQPEEAVPSIQVEEAAEEKAASVPLSSDDPIAQLMSEQDLEKASTSAAHAAEFVRQTEDVVSNLGQAIDKAFDGMSDRQQDS